MTPKSPKTIRLIKETASRLQEEMPIGTKVYALLADEEGEGQVVEAKVRGYDGYDAIVTYEREDGIPAIERVFLLNISASREELQKVINL